MKTILKILFIILLYSTQSITQDFWQQANKKNTRFNDNTKAKSTTTFDSTLAQKLQEILDYERSSRNIKGVSTAVIIPGQGTWTGVSGVSHDTVEVKQDMLFGIASITKNYTAPLILKLAEEGFLTLDDSLHEWLPAYNNIDSTITIRQLLNMTSGVYCYINDNSSFHSTLISDLTRFWTPEEILTLVGPPNFAPGTSWGYSSTNYTLLGMIIKEATGSSISVELRNRFLDPLSLNKTYLAGEDTLIGEIAHPWHGSSENLKDHSYIYDTANFSLSWTSGAMFSTAKDVAQWAQALFGGTVLNQEYTNQMVTFIPVDVAGYPPEITGYGFGAWRFNILGRESWGGVGIWYGYIDLVAYLPEDSISIVVLLNERKYDGSFNFQFRNAFDILAALLNPVTGITDESPVIPVDYKLRQNYPNPFNPTTSIEFTLPKSEYVELKVYNILGKKVATLVSNKLNQGNHTYTFDGKNLASGVYYYQLIAGDFQEVKKMVLIK